MMYSYHGAEGKEGAATSMNTASAATVTHRHLLPVVTSRRLPTMRRPRPQGPGSVSRYRSRRLLDLLQIGVAVLLLLVAIWPLLYHHRFVLTISPDGLLGFSLQNTRAPMVNYITHNATLLELQKKERSILHEYADLALSMTSGNRTWGRLKSCRYDANAGQKGMYHVDPFGHCSRKSSRISSMLLHNPFHLERRICGRTIPGSSSIVLTLADVSSVRNASANDYGNGEREDPWKCLEEPSRLYNTIPTIENAMNFPPIQLAKGTKSKTSDPIEWPCDVPCHKEKKFAAGIVKTIYINGPGYSWPFKHSMEGGGYYSSLAIDPEAYKKNQFYATTSFRSEVPLSYFSFEDFKIQNPPVEYDKVIKGASFMARNCASKSGREAMVRGLIAFADKLKQKSNSSDTFRVDSVSTCLHNAEPPPGADMKDKVDVIRHYLFHLSFENSITEDYVTEKLWGALESGSLPVYLGAPNVKVHAPPHSIIHASDFDTPEALGEYLVKVASNKTLYESYHAWRSKPLPESFLRKFNHTNTHSECRFCRWAYARMYGLSFDYESQSLHDTRVSRQACMIGLRQGQGMLTSPIFEHWRLGRDPMRNRLVYGATYNSTCGIEDSSRSVTLSGVGGDLLQRDVWEHDGVIDLHIRAIGYIEADTTFDLTIRATALSSGNVTSMAAKGYAYMQSDTSRFTVFATSGVSYRGGSPGENALSVIIPSERLPVRIRILTEDVDTFHVGGDRADTYYATVMQHDFENPLEGFYMQSGGE